MTDSKAGDDEVNKIDSKIIADAMSALADSSREYSERLIRQEANAEHMSKTMTEMGKSINELTTNVGQVVKTMLQLSADTNHIEQRVAKDVDIIAINVRKLEARVAIAESGLQNIHEIHSEEKGYRKGSDKWSNWFATNWFKIISLLGGAGAAVYTVSTILSRLPAAT